MGNILEKIYKAGLRLLERANVEETYIVIIKEALKLVKAEYGSIFLYSRGDLRRVYSNDQAFYYIKVRKRGYTYRVFKTGKPAIINYKQIKRIHPYDSVGLHPHSDVMIPLSIQGKNIGVLTFMSTRDHKFTKDDLNILKLFGPLASLAIRKAQLFDEVRKAVEVRDLFISMAAHELRTPLTAVNGYTQLLYSKLSGSNSPESRWTEQLLWETKRFANLVNELLQINRIKSGQFDYFFKECSLREIARRVTENFKPTYPNRQLIFEDHLEPNTDTIIGDYDKMLQVLSNLVDNAIKFSPSHEPVLLRLVTKGSDLIVEVKDKGYGIAKEDLQRIFDDYYRGTGRDQEGMGIGLYIVKNVIDQHHGTITVKSKTNKGTQVRIKLPRIVQ